MKKMFEEYDWPGNVRELRNAIERAMIFEEGPYISEEYLPLPTLRSPAHRPDGSVDRLLEAGLSLPEMERLVLVKALTRTGGNKTRAAELLKITRDTLRYKLKKYAIKAEEMGLSGE